MKNVKNLIWILLLIFSILFFTKTYTYASIRQIDHVFNFTPILVNDHELLVLGGWNNSKNVFESPYKYNLYTQVKTTINTKMHYPRYGYSLFQIDENNILIIGGKNKHGKYVYLAEIYNIKNQTFETIGRTNFEHNQPSILKMNDGNIFIISFSKAEIYNPKTKLFKIVGELKTYDINGILFNYNTLNKYSVNKAIGLDNGKILIIGNWNGVQNAELYNPKINKFEHAGTPISPRFQPTLSLLHDGSVLIAGGGIDKNSKTAELYDPKNNKFIKTGALRYGRYYHSAITLNNGKVLVVGGMYGQDEFIKYRRSIELYNPKTKKFRVIGFSIIRPMLSNLKLYKKNKVLIYGNGKVEIFRYQ